MISSRDEHRTRIAVRMAATTAPHGTVSHPTGTAALASPLRPAAPDHLPENQVGDWTVTSPVNFGCSFPGCDRHPRNGDTILRISAKGTPFVGRCEEHYGDETGPELARSAEAAAREATG